MNGPTPITVNEAMTTVFAWLRAGERVRVLPEILSGKTGLRFQAVTDEKVLSSLDYFEGEEFSRP